MATELLNFTVTIGSESRLYANANQQMPVTVRMQKRVNGVNVALSVDEIRSIRLVERAQSTLPPNWSFTAVRDLRFNHGMWQGRSSALSHDFNEEDVVLSNPVEEQESAAIETFTVFLSTWGIAQTRHFMATVDIAGLGLVVSFGTSGGETRTQSIEIQAVPPYHLNAADLSEIHDLGHERGDKGHRASVWVFYWNLPSSLHIVLDQHISGGGFVRSGLRFFFDTNRILHARIPPEITSLRTVQLRPGDHDHNIRLLTGHRAIRALVSYSSNFPQQWRLSDTIHFQITDSFGCFHRYRMFEQNNHTIALRNS